jgi:hypothetical protein
MTWTEIINYTISLQRYCKTPGYAEEEGWCMLEKERWHKRAKFPSFLVGS